MARLLDRGVRTRALVRDPEKAETLFGKQDSDKLQILPGDTRHPEELNASVFEMSFAVLERQLFHPSAGMGITPLKGQIGMVSAIL